MTDMMIQDINEELDDLRNLGDDDNTPEPEDDLRNLAEDDAVAEDASEENVSPEASVEDDDDEIEDDSSETFSTSTQETPVVAVEDSDNIEAFDEEDDEEIIEDTVDEPVAAIDSDDTDEDDDEEVSEPVVAAAPVSSAPAPSTPTAEVKPAPVASPVPSAPAVKPAPVAAVEINKEEKPVVEKAAVAAPTPKAEPIASSSNEDDYNPSLALQVFTIVRHGFVVVFDLILTVVAIIVERIASIDWGWIFGSIADLILDANDMMKDRVPKKFHMVVYGILALLIILPIGFGAFSIFSGGNNAGANTNNQIVNINQNTATGNGILAPVFSHNVQQWSEDIERWTANTPFTPDMFAIVMQLESCGNPNLSGGLFGANDNSDGFIDADTQASTALEQLQVALNATNGDFPMALAVYADGESVMTADFGEWSLHARDMFILGRVIQRHIDAGYTTSPDLDSWIQTTGSIVCSETQTMLNN